MLRILSVPRIFWARRTIGHQKLSMSSSWSSPQPLPWNPTTSLLAYYFKFLLSLQGPKLLTHIFHKNWSSNKFSVNWNSSYKMLTFYSLLNNSLSILKYLPTKNWHSLFKIHCRGCLFGTTLPSFAFIINLNSNSDVAFCPCSVKLMSFFQKYIIWQLPPSTLSLATAACPLHRLLSNPLDS